MHFGFMGRSPDHVASCIGGMLMGLDLFEAYDRKRAGALRDYYRYARDNDLFLTYVIINPQADRSKPAHRQADPHLAAGVVDEDGHGLTIRGAKMLATSSIMANEVFVTCIQPLVAGDEKQAVSFAVPDERRRACGCCRANPTRKTPARNSTIRCRAGSMRTMRCCISTT